MLTEEQRVGSYTIMSCIDTCQFSLYKAINGDGKKVAVKVSAKYAVDCPIDRSIIRKEAEILQRLSHPNIVRFEEFLEDQNILVMEYLDGPNLDDFVTTSGRLTERRTLVYGRQAASALAYMHSLSPVVIHGDVKPKNLIVVSNEVKFVDFGSSAIPESFTQVYAPSERTNRRTNYPVSDVYSLGWTLYFCLSGADPKIRKVESKKDLRKLRISKRFKALLFSALEDEYVYRPSAVELLRELEAIC